ncbi:DUF4232 domain-containing protein [Streptomyces formicae]|uniref:Glycine-rich secreted protein n=1 Tax=Streptomyces formicae TaxID=1616117 RepID=A0A291Q8K1_9ACTN|nr:DUF4232 domain-containing protein [Streptomyces formicae]ATL27815.1 glycine-rich secreted protein [Streptomyces formicae]
MRVRKLTTFAALAVAASLSLTACNGDDVASGDSSSASSASSGGGSDQGGSNDTAGKDSGGEKPAPAGKDSAGSGSDSGQSGKAAKCRTDDLDITASDSTIDGDTDGSVAVTFKNGGADCALSGFAGVDLKTSEGDLSATRAGQGASPTTLNSGESVSFSISYPVNDSGGSGVKITGLVVTPPGETKPFSLEWPGAATLPVTDGSGSPVKVHPIGSAGQGGAQ